MSPQIMTSIQIHLPNFINISQKCYFPLYLKFLPELLRDHYAEYVTSLDPCKP